MTARLSIIVAVSDNNVIGNKGGIPWKIPEDLKRFKRLTEGHPVIMGRNTWESIPERFRPLPERTNIVISRRFNYVASGAEVVTSPTSAWTFARRSEGGDSEMFIIGGEAIYEEALKSLFVERVYLTIVHKTFLGDTFFPKLTRFMEEVEREEHETDEGLCFTFLTLDKVWNVIDERL